MTMQGPTCAGEIVNHGPTYIWVEPTSRCNTRCKHCRHYYSTFGQDMDEGVYEKIRDEALKDVRQADIVGYGEPFLARHFMNMLEDYERRGIRVLTVSNGILLRNLETVKKLANSQLTVLLSMEGARKETFEYVRPHIKWERMVETLECLKQGAGAAGSDRGLRFGINFCSMKQNIGDLPDLVRLAHRYGVKNVIVNTLSSEDLFPEVAGQSLHDSPELVSPQCLEALRLAGQLGVVLTLSPMLRELTKQGAERRRGIKGKILYGWRKAQVFLFSARIHGWARQLRFCFHKGGFPKAKAGGGFCPAPWNSAFFAGDGTVAPCCVEGEILGDLREQSWNEIWNGPLYRSLRRTAHSWNPPSICRCCTMATGINGGDEHAYERFFAGFPCVPVSLESKEVEFREGFYLLERNADGSPSHRWMDRMGTMELPMKTGAKFLRLHIIPHAPGPRSVPGRCVINGGAAEPFDNSCATLHFPLDHVREGQLEVRLEMEESRIVPPDPRNLALGVSGIEFLG